MGRYRIRAWLRRHLPLFLADRIPKGRDCMQHEWQFYGLDEDQELHFGCVYCEVETTDPPWSVQEFIRRRLVGLFAEADGLRDNDLNPSVELRYRTILHEAEELMEVLESFEEAPRTDPTYDFANFLRRVPLSSEEFTKEQESVEA